MEDNQNNNIAQSELNIFQYDEEMKNTNRNKNHIVENNLLQQKADKEKLTLEGKYYIPEFTLETILFSRKDIQSKILD